MLKTHVDFRKYDFINRRLTNKMKNEKYHNVVSVPKSQKKKKKSIPLIYQLTYTTYSMYINIVSTVLCLLYTR